MLTKPELQGMLVAYRDAVKRTVIANVSQNILPPIDYERILQDQRDLESRFVETIFSELEDHRGDTQAYA